MMCIVLGVLFQLIRVRVNLVQSGLVVVVKGGHWAVHLYMCTFMEFNSKKCVHLKDIRMDDRTMFQNKKRYENQ